MGVVVKVVPPGVEVTGVGVVMVDTGAGVGICVEKIVAVVGIDALDVEMTGVGVVMVGADAGVSMVVRVRGCGSTGPKRLVGAVVGVAVEVVPADVEIVGVRVVVVGSDSMVDVVVVRVG